MRPTRTDAPDSSATFKKSLAALGLGVCIASHSTAQVSGAAYLDGGASQVGVLLAHGRGLWPTSQVVNPLRLAINSQLGAHTLSLAMPVLPGKYTPARVVEYAATFPKAYQTIAQGIEFLQGKGVQRIYLVGYSMGARMSSAYLASHAESAVVGHIGIGMLGGGAAPLNTDLNIRNIHIPTLEVYAENDEDARFALGRKALLSEHYTQVAIAGATHDYRCCEAEVAAHVIRWIQQHELK